MYSLSEPLLGLALLALLVLASEFGFRAGRRRGPTSSDAVRQQVGNIQAALLALFALLLAFTFSMALSRFDQRRQLVVREANAIGTAALRARLLPAPQRVEAADCSVGTSRSGWKPPAAPTSRRRAVRCLTTRQG